MFKRHSSPNIPPYYLRLARHWRMGAHSSDIIRQRLLQRGVSWEKSLEVIDFLDREDASSAGFSLGGRAPQARAWLISYSVMMGVGIFLLLFDAMLVPSSIRCNMAGYGLLGIGLVGLMIYGLNAVFMRFL